MSKGLRKEDLEQDILIEYSSRFMYFYERNKAAVIGGGIGIIAVIALSIGYFIYMNQQESQAQELLGMAEGQFMLGQFETALYGDDEQTLGFVQIANNFGRTNAGNLAKYYAAAAEYELGNFESALEFIKEFNVPRGIIGVSPTSMHGSILAELERYEEAANMFLRAANMDQNSTTTPYNLLKAAFAFKEAGQNNRAIEMVDRILDEYGNSQQVANAQRLKGQLMVRG